MKILQTIVPLCLVLFITGCSEKNSKYQKKLCKPKNKTEHIKIPASDFVNKQEVTCQFGKYHLSRQADSRDPGHTLYLVTPPEGVEKAYDCDSKADNGINKISMNCLLVEDESKEHET